MFLEFQILRQLINILFFLSLTLFIFIIFTNSYPLLRLVFYSFSLFNEHISIGRLISLSSLYYFLVNHFSFLLLWLKPSVSKICFMNRWMPQLIIISIDLCFIIFLLSFRTSQHLSSVNDWIQEMSKHKHTGLTLTQIPINGLY